MKTLEINVIEDSAKIDNLSLIVDLIDSQFKSYNTIKTRKEIEDSLKNALSQKSRAVLFIAEDQPGNYIGFAFANINSGLESGGDYLWLNELFTVEEDREKGVGSSIIKFIEKWCNSRSIGYIACSTGVKNTRAQSFYKGQEYDLYDTIWVDKEIE